MGSVNNGNQYITFAYKHPAKGADFSTLLRDGLQPGIYDGGELTKVDDSTVQVSPYTAYINSSTDKMVRVKSRAAYNVTVSNTSNLIYLSYNWVEATSNYADYNTRLHTDSPVTNEVVLGHAVYSGTSIIDISYDYKTLGQNDKINHSFENIKNTIEDNNLNLTDDLTDDTLLFTAIERAINKIAIGTPAYVNLVIKNNAATPNSKVDIDCDSIYVGWKKHTSVDLTLDITASGALGLDTGTESADAWYYIWLIAKLDGTLSGVLSASATAPTLPSGYVFSKLVGCVRNTSGNFVAFYQTNDIIQVALLNIKTNYNPGTSLVALDCSAFYPAAITSMARLNVEIGGASGNYVISPTSSGLGQVYDVVGTSSIGNQHDVFVTSENIYFRYSGGASSRFLFIAISAYQIKI